MEDSFEHIDDEIFLNVDVEIEKSKEKKSSQEVKKSSPDDSFDDISEDDDFLLTAAKKCDDDDHHSTKSDEDSILFTQPRPYEKQDSPPTKKDSKKRPSPVIDGNEQSKRIRFTQESVQEIKFSLDDEWFLTIQTPPGCSNAQPGKIFSKFSK